MRRVCCLGPVGRIYRSTAAQRPAATAPQQHGGQQQRREQCHVYSRRRRRNTDLNFRFITARCYASAVLAMGLCPSVSVCLCLCPCLSQAGVLLKRQNVGSHKQHHTIPRDSSFLMPKISAKFDRPGSPPTGASNAGGVGQNL